MRPVKNTFSVLAERAGGGDATAKVQLHRELEPQMVRIVRRTMQQGTGASLLERRIFAEADRVGLNADTVATEEAEYLVRQIAQSLCAQALAGVRPMARKRSNMEDTVLA